MAIERKAGTMSAAALADERSTMGKLIDQARRNKARAAKGKRKKQIMTAGSELFQRYPYPEITLEAISRRAKVKDGLATLYFGSKEELFLHLLINQQRLWFEELEQQIGKLTESKQLPRLLSHSLADRPLLVRLLSLQHVVIEAGLAAESVLIFLQGQEMHMTRCGALMERQCPQLATGQGAWLLHRTVLLAVGLQSAIGPYPPSSTVFAVDLREDLHRLVKALLLLTSTAGAGE